MSLSRRGLIGVAVALAASPALADSSADTTALIQRIYRRGKALPGDLSVKLRLLIAQDAGRRLDFDWLHGGREAPPVVSRLRVNTLNVSGTFSAAVMARFTNHGRETFRRFHLVRLLDAWVIDDVRMHPEGLNLVELLTSES